MRDLFVRSFGNLYRSWRKEPLIPGLLLIIAGSLWGFVAIADEVREGGTPRMDESILLAMRSPADKAHPVGPSWLPEAARDITALGGMTILSALTVVSIGAALIVGKPRLAIISLAAVVGGSLTMKLLKGFFDRARPDVIPHAMDVSTASFPSGHSMMSTVVYLVLGVLLARTQSRRALRLYILALSVLIVLLVGMSRVYLGVHWPSDVLGGWTLGAAWALVFWIVAMKVDQSEPT